MDLLMEQEIGLKTTFKKLLSLMEMETYGGVDQLM